MRDIRDFGIAVADAIRLNDCFNELSRHLAERPAVVGDEPHWHTKAEASAGNEEWVHSVNSRNIAEMMLRCAIEAKRLTLWIRLENSESRVDAHALKEISFRTLRTGSYSPVNPCGDFLNDRPLWIKKPDWQVYLGEAMWDRYQEIYESSDGSARIAQSVPTPLSGLLKIWWAEADLFYKEDRNRVQASMGVRGQTGGSDYIIALCSVAEQATKQALSKARKKPQASQHLDAIESWALSLFDVLAATSRRFVMKGRLSTEGDGILADRTLAAARLRIGQELAKWILEKSSAIAPVSVSKFGIEAQKVKVCALPIAEAKLLRWWESTKANCHSLPEKDILAAAKAAFPKNMVSRQRVRDLIGPRKRGPKGFSAKAPAK